jgi:hypothetical protein
MTEPYHRELTRARAAGVALARTVFSRAAHDAGRVDARELAIAPARTAQRPGDYTVRGQLDFAVGQIGSRRRPKTVPVAGLVAVR